MNTLQIGVAVAAAVVLFLFGIEHFSREIQAVSGQRFRRFLARGTNNRFAGFALGGVVTAIIQSSTATSVIAVGLVNAGVLSFRQTLGVLFGANVGTTLTAQLVALNLTAFAPVLILVGFIVGYLPFRWRIFGRSIFYFGLVFFSLQLVSVAVEPLKTNPTLIASLASFDNLFWGILAGALFTGLVQSSSVTTGVAIVLMSQGTLTLAAALPLVLGANVGTTVTSLVAAASLDSGAKRTAVSHSLYNILGVVLFMPFIGLLGSGLLAVGLQGATALATAHLIFNLVTACLFLAFLEPFARLVERIVPEDADPEEPIEPLKGAVFDQEDHGAEATWRWAEQVVKALRRGYTAAVLALQTRDRAIDNQAGRVEALVNYALEEAALLLREIASGEISESRSEAALRFAIIIDHLRQLQDSLTDLRDIGERLDRQHSRFSVESLLEVQAVLPVYARLLDALSRIFAEDTPETSASLEVRLEQAEMQIQHSYRRFLTLVRQLHERGELASFLSIHQRLRTKIEAFGEYSQRRRAEAVEPELNPLSA